MPIRQSRCAKPVQQQQYACLKHFYGIAAAASPPLADAPLRYTVCHTACSSYGIRHGSSCVPFMPLRSLRPPFRYISPRALPYQCSRPGNRFPASLSFEPNSNSLIINQVHWIPIIPTPQRVCTALPQLWLLRSHKILANGHWVPFRSTTAFIHFSSIQSTRCQ
jgi:hypothetical protein